IFEMPPVGMLALRDHLARQGHAVGWFNLASRMLRDPGFDVTDFLSRLDSPIFGLDLHWLAHAHGSLAVASLIREIHPRAEILLGGHSASYFADELVARPEVDLVQPGYNTLGAVTQLLRAGRAPSDRAAVPGLVWQHDGAPRRNPPPAQPPDYDVPVDWGRVFGGDARRTPYHITIPQAGCRYGCRWCGGSAAASRRLFGLRGEALKPGPVLREELSCLSLTGEPGRRRAHTATLIDFFHEEDGPLEAALAGMSRSGIGAVHYSIRRLPDVERARRMIAGRRVVMELSPDSHDPEIARRGGRGAYTMEEMEHWIGALEAHVRSVEVYFMIGLPGQTERSVDETVDYCETLLARFPSGRVVPFLCPMLPFLDPGSDIFEDPERWGYSLHHRTLEDHRAALLAPSWRGRLNYETDAMDRSTLVRVSYRAVERLTRIKVERGVLPAVLGERLAGLIGETRDLMNEIEVVEALASGPQREERWRRCRQKIGAYNSRHATAVRSQQRPADLGFARDQWFDTDLEIDGILGDH
ncbi:MAG: hypothetical protein QGH45_15365, partial [Myxococcota bacterium]|nr:hypothetical protein [Myxococcota bacterium]